MQLELEVAGGAYLLCPTCDRPYGKRRRCYYCQPGNKKTGSDCTCLQCGGTFYAPLWHLTDPRYNGGRYCSPTCRHAALRKDPIIAGKTKRWAQGLRYRHGMSVPEYEAILATQDGKCAICFREPGIGPGKTLHVDHCHESGAVRGLLCSKCNTMLGLSGDDVSRLEGAIHYLEERM